MGKFLSSFGQKAVVFASRQKTIAALMVLTLFSVASFAADPVAIPSLGTDVSEYINAAILLMGSVVGVAVGGYAAFLIVKKALRWLGRALG